MKQTTVKHEFVDFIPDVLADGTVYISIRYCTAAHKCCCGCGREVVTPLSPHDWAVTFNGRVVSLYPSIGNWSYPCRSHYWIKNCRVVWAENWSQSRIDAGRRQTTLERSHSQQSPELAAAPPPTAPAKDQSAEGLWKRVREWLG